MLHIYIYIYMWNKRKRAARVDVVRERERVDVVKLSGSLKFIWHFLSQIYSWEWFCMVLQESLENINFMPSVTTFYCTPRCFLVRCIMNWCKNNGKQNASLVCLGSHCSSPSFSHSLKCGLHSQWGSMIQHWQKHTKTASSKNGDNTETIRVTLCRDDTHELRSIL